MVEENFENEYSEKLKVNFTTWLKKQGPTNLNVGNATKSLTNAKYRGIALLFKMKKIHFDLYKTLKIALILIFFDNYYFTMVEKFGI